MKVWLNVSTPHGNIMVCIQSHGSGIFFRAIGGRLNVELPSNAEWERID
jgi:hypothetical protein